MPKKFPPKYHNRIRLYLNGFYWRCQLFFIHSHYIFYIIHVDYVAFISPKKETPLFYKLDYIFISSVLLVCTHHAEISISNPIIIISYAKNRKLSSMIFYKVSINFKNVSMFHSFFFKIPYIRESSKWFVIVGFVIQLIFNFRHMVRT